MNKEHCVFISEESIYSNVKLSLSCQVETSSYLSIFLRYMGYPIIIAGVTAMERKLATYAQHQLPGGIYWDPEPKIKGNLCKLEPSNDICESILGLND